MEQLDFPRMNREKGAPKYEHYDESKTKEMKKDMVVFVLLGGQRKVGRVVFFFTDDKGEEHAGVTIDRLFLVRKVSDIVS